MFWRQRSGVDIKYKGYILVAPSRFDGGEYQWQTDHKPAEAPDWVLTAKLDRQKSMEPKAQTQYDVSSPRTGVNVNQVQADASRAINWHDNVLRLVGHMIAKGATDAEVHEKTDALTLDGYTVDQTRCEIQVMIDGARLQGKIWQHTAVCLHLNVSVSSCTKCQELRFSKIKKTGFWPNGRSVTKKPMLVLAWEVRQKNSRGQASLPPRKQRGPMHKSYSDHVFSHQTTNAFKHHLLDAYLRVQVMVSC